MAGSAATSPVPTLAIASPGASDMEEGPFTPPPPTVTSFADGVTSTHRSERFGVAVDGAYVTDEDSITNAMRRKAARNLDYSGTDLNSNSFLSFSPQSIQSKLSSVGVSLGKSKKSSSCFN